MKNILRTRFRQGFRTVRFPPVENPLPERFRGLPVVDPSKCAGGCPGCGEACPTGALLPGKELKLDLGKCVFCGDCARSCPRGAVKFTNGYGLASTSREGLVLGGDMLSPKVEKLSGEIGRLFGRSLKLREVSAGGCNGCEADLNVLSTVVFDLGRFGIQFVASPRHADGLVVTGPVTRNMRSALLSTYEAVPSPKLVVAVGACAISGGVFAGGPAVAGIPREIPVDLFIPGCPPHPLTTLDGLLRLLGRL